MEIKEMKDQKLTLKNTREQNLKVTERALWGSKEYKSMRESIKKKTGLDIANADQFPVHEGRFDWKKAQDKLREADSASAFTQVLVAGVSNVANAAYQSVETTYEDWVQVSQTDLFETPLAPLQGITFPREVGPNEAYPELRAAGLNLKLRMRKFGSLYPLEMELEQFDQTGQFPMVGSKMLGEYMKLVHEVYVMGKLASVANMKYSNLTIPTSETQPSDETVYPWSNSLVGGGRSRLSTYKLLTQAAIQEADINLMNQLNILGLKMQAKGSRIVVGPKWKFDASVLLNSAFYPTAQTSGTGTFQSINPIQGLYNLSVSRFMFDNSGSANANSFAWYLIDDTKPWFVMMLKEAIMIQQEAQNAGQSFERDIIRFKGRTQFNCDIVDPRFAMQGNDGSVTS
jgi:hypothetical protein